MLAAHQLLLVGEDGVILYAPEGNTISRALSIGWQDRDFRRKLAKACAGHPRHPVVVLFNHGDQAYRKEDNLTAAECMKSFDRALPEDAFPGRAMMRTTRAGRNRQASYLMVALPLLENMTILSRALSEATVAVETCAVLPVESTGLVAALADKAFAGGKKSRWAALTGQHETGGLRTVVTRDGRLALTRLTPLADRQRGGADWAANVAQEFGATKEYLARFGYEEKDGLDLMVVCGKPEARLLQAEKPPATRLRCLTPAEALKLLGLGAAGRAGGGFADDLHAAWAEHQRALTLPIPMPGLTRH